MSEKVFKGVNISKLYLFINIQMH